MLQNPCNPEISNFDLATLRHEDVLSLQISMKDLSIMNVLDSQCHLNEPVENLVLGVTYFSNFLLICDPGIQIVAVRIVHDNTETSLVHETFLISNDVRMSHRFKHMHLIDGIFSLLTVHL